MKKSKIVFTGGGSAGHVTPNLALIASLCDSWEMAYIGSYSGVEKEIIGKTKLAYFSISTGKLRRYFSWENFIDPFKTVFGIFQALRILWKLRPDVVFSKGGFVAFPVVVAAKCLKIPVIAHESDLTPGLANRMSYYFANKILLSFPESKKYFKPSQKVIFTGTPVRKEVLQGDPNKGRAYCGFNQEKPIVLVICGGLGSQIINAVIEENIDELLQHYQVMHICGKHEDKEHSPKPGYFRFGYVHEPLADLFAASDIIISRAGANSIWELLALAKPHILIPLSKKASRGDQISNAKYFASQGLSQVIEEDDLTGDILLKELLVILKNYAAITQRLRLNELGNGTDNVLIEIKKQVKS